MPGDLFIRRLCVDELKLNQDETELIVFAPKHHVKEFSECCLSFDGCIVNNASFVKKLGIFFDRTLCMHKQASAITKSCYFKIRNIGHNRSYTTEDACKTLICSLVTSRLDCGNAWFTQHSIQFNSIQSFI